MDEETPKTKSTGLPKWLVVVIVVVLVLGAGASVATYLFSKIAGRVAKTVIEQKTGTQIDLNSDKNTIRVKSADGSFEMGTATSWPAEIPASVPHFNSGAITGSVKTGNAWSIIFENVEESDVDAYAGQLKSLGWTTIAEISGNVKVFQLENDAFQTSLSYDASSKGFTLLVAAKE